MPQDDPQLAELISTAMQMRDDGVPLHYEDLCRQRPDLIEEVREAVRLSEQLPEISADTNEKRRILAGRYRLEGTLGSGAMGVVYRATDKELGRPVAVKILRAAILGEQEAAARFAREAEAMAAIAHPAVATIHDRGQTDSGETFLVMELLEGSSLASLLEHAGERSIDAHSQSTAWIAAMLGARDLGDDSYLRTVAHWCAELADGLHAAHTAGVTHRDIKPSNVFITREGRCVLLDFGIASRQSHATITREGGALGTPAYMAPEAIDARHKPTSAVDIYGLAATLYHLVTLRAPFEGTPSQVLHSLSRRDPTPAYRLYRGIPRDLQAILDKGMSRNPAGRYDNPAAFAADLRAFLGYRPVSARPVTTLTRCLRRVRRSPALLASASVAAAIGLTLGAIQWHASQLAAQHTDYWALRKQFAPNLTVLTSKLRQASSEAERIDTLSLLDRAVAVSPDPVAILAMRAAYRDDHGNRAGCVEDMTALAAHTGTAFANKIAEHMRAAETDADAWQLPFAELPKPDSHQDLLLGGYLAIRMRNFEIAAKWLADSSLDDSVEAEHLRIFLAIEDLAAIEAPNERIDPALAVYLRVNRLEDAIGHPTAHTHHVASYVLLLQQRLEECQREAEAALSMSPYAYSAGFNAAVAARRLGRTEDAVRTLKLLRDTRPDYYKPYWSMFFTLIDAQETERAAALLDTAKFGQGAAGEWRKASQYGVLNAERSVRLYLDGKREEAVRAARDSDAEFQRAATIANVRNRSHWALSQAIAVDNINGVFTNMMKLQTNRPLNWRRLRAVLAWMPDDLDEEQTKVVRDFFAWVSQTLSLRANK